MKGGGGDRKENRNITNVKLLFLCHQTIEC